MVACHYYLDSCRKIIDYEIKLDFETLPQTFVPESHEIDFHLSPTASLLYVSCKIMLTRHTKGVCASMGSKPEKPIGEFSTWQSVGLVLCQHYPIPLDACTLCSGYGTVSLHHPSSGIFHWLHFESGTFHAPASGRNRSPACLLWQGPY